MALDLYWELAALFYEQDSVHLPGIGGFVLRSAPAELDPVQGKVEAPSRQVTFDPSLVIDDGLLAGRLREVHQLSAAEAERRINSFTKEIRATLDRGELVAFPGIGRLYRNYNGELQFLPDGRNFSTETFGLQPVEIQAVTRPSRPAGTASPAGKRAATYSAPNRMATATTSPAWLTWIRANLFYIIGATAVIFLIGMFLLSQENDANTPELDRPEGIPRERLNVPPSAPPAAEEPAAEEPIQEDVPETPPAVPEANTYRYAVIAVGLFGNEANVQKMLRRIEQVGLDPFTAREGNLTRVGVQVRYEQDSELTAALRRVQARIEDGAFILEKDGRRQQPR